MGATEYPLPWSLLLRAVGLVLIGLLVRTLAKGYAIRKKLHGQV